MPGAVDEGNDRLECGAPGADHDRGAQHVTGTPPVSRRRAVSIRLRRCGESPARFAEAAEVDDLGDAGALGLAGDVPLRGSRSSKSAIPANARGSRRPCPFEDSPHRRWHRRVGRRHRVRSFVPPLADEIATSSWLSVEGTAAALVRWCRWRRRLRFSLVAFCRIAREVTAADGDVDAPLHRV